MNEYTGKANTIDEAIKLAAQDALASQGPDAMVEFEIKRMRGIHGGIGGLHQVEVTIKELSLMKMQLCDRAVEYRGFQKQGVVTILAYGSHDTSGYKVMLQLKPIEIFPPQYYLVHERPSGISLPVVTPFVVSESFKSKDIIKEIIVEDAHGSREVKIIQVGPQQVISVSDVQLDVIHNRHPQLYIRATGLVPSEGWTNPVLEPFRYVKPPADGIYDYTFTATPPLDVSVQVLTPIKVELAMNTIPDTLRGIRIHAKDNEKLVMLDNAEIEKTGAETVFA